VIIVFPSQYTRENPDLPAPDGIELRIRFNGPLQNIYSILTVRLYYSEHFQVTEIWKNGIVLRDDRGRRAGFQIADFADGHGEIALFFEHGIEAAFKSDLTDFVLQHVFGMAASDSIRTRKIFRCRECSTEIIDAQIEGRRRRGYHSIICNVCGDENHLSDVEETVAVAAPSPRTTAAIAGAQVVAEREANLSVGSAILQGPEIAQWLQEDLMEAHVAVVFTDIVASTRTNQDVGDLAMDEIRENHFETLRGIAKRFNGLIIKNTGDGVIAIFKSTVHAVQFASLAFTQPGDDAIRIRVAIHVGRVRPRQGDIYGQTVNYTAKVESYLKGKGIVLSQDAK